MIPLPEPEVGYQTWTGQCRGAYTADQMHAHAAAARRQALEEAALLCTQRYETNTALMQKQRGIRARDLHSACAIEAHLCSNAIRSLIDKDTA